MQNVLHLEAFDGATFKMNVRFFTFSFMRIFSRGFYMKQHEVWVLSQWDSKICYFRKFATKTFLVVGVKEAGGEIRLNGKCHTLLQTTV
jgi:hypothetical protein